MSPDVTKPLPVPDDLSSGYWAAAATGTLALPRCAACGRYAMPPTAVCPNCGSSDPDYSTEPIEGGATVRSWTIVRDSFLPGFAADVPYVLVDVELDAQSNIRMIGRLVDGVDAPLALGDRVAVTFDRLADGMAVPAFVLETT